MGLRLISTSTSDEFKTVCTIDDAIEADKSDMKAFDEDRANLSVLKFKASPSDKLWEGPVFFHVRPLDEFEFGFAINASSSQAVAMGDGLTSGKDFSLLAWCFRLGVTNWENFWRFPGRGEGDLPVLVNYLSQGITGDRKSVDSDLMEYVPSEVLVDIGGLVLGLSTVSETEGKASGSLEQTQSTSDSSPESVTSLETETTSALEPAPATPTSDS